ncbi:MAG: tetratricopeptide repeat protein, partial [Bacteroidia bacterium]
MIHKTHIIRACTFLVWAFLFQNAYSQQDFNSIYQNANHQYKLADSLTQNFGSTQQAIDALETCSNIIGSKNQSVPDSLIKLCCNCKDVEASIFTKIGETQKAVEILLPVIEVAKNKKFKNTYIDAVINLIIAYRTQSRLALAEQTGRNAIKNYTLQPLDRAIILENLAEIFVEEKRYKAAKKYALEAASLFEQTAYPFYAAVARSHIGDSYLAQEKYTAALHAYKHLPELYLKEGGGENEFRPYFKLLLKKGEILLALNQFGEALDCFHQVQFTILKDSTHLSPEYLPEYDT